MEFNSTSSKLIYILRSLGLNNSLLGTKLIIQAVIIIKNQNSEFYKMDSIIKYLSLISSDYSENSVRNAIKYSLDKRNKELSLQNFEKHFGIEYNEYFFSCNRFIEELTRII